MDRLTRSEETSVDFIQTCTSYLRKPHGDFDWLNRLTEISRILMQPDYQSTILERAKNRINIDCLPTAIALPLLQSVFACREDPQSLRHHKDACLLIGRKDLAYNLDSQNIPQDVSEIIKLRFRDADQYLQVNELLAPTTDDIVQIQVNTSMRYSVLLSER